MGRAAPVGTDWVQTLRARGYRLTPQRQLVLEAVGELGHGTPDEIGAAVQQRVAGVSLSTVYRALELLEELGLVRHAHLGHGAPTYSVADDAPHVHLKCRQCGGIDDVPPDVFDDVAQRLLVERGFLVDMGHFAVFGLCGTCRGGIARAEGGLEQA